MLSVCGEFWGPYFLPFTHGASFFIILYQSIISTTMKREKKLQLVWMQEGFKRVTRKQEAFWSQRFVTRLQWMVALWCGASSSFWLREIWPQYRPRRTRCSCFEPVFLECSRFCRTQRTATSAVYVVSPVNGSPRKGAMIPSAFQQSFSDQLNSFIANHQQDAAASMLRASVATVSQMSPFKCCNENSQGKKISDLISL